MAPFDLVSQTHLLENALAFVIVVEYFTFQTNYLEYTIQTENRPISI